MTGYPPPPQKYLNTDWINPSIHPDKLADLLVELDYHSKNYLVKNHFANGEQRDLLLGSNDTYIFDIKRKLSDVVVSAYYHKINKDLFNKPFPFYYWRYGRNVAIRVRDYHEIWKSEIYLGNRVYISSFRLLKEDFESECRRIGNFLDMKLSNDDIKIIKEKTTISSLREKYDNKGFFRKGGTDYKQEYMSRLMEKDIDKIKMGKYSLNTLLHKICEGSRSIFWGSIDYLINQG
jgi:hypothetical protein